jgi:hypothetical protein
MLGRGFGVRFRSPLDRLRRANELIAVQQTFEFAGQIARFDPTVLDRLDTERVFDLAHEINGAQWAIFKRDEDVEQLRAERDELAPAQVEFAAATNSIALRVRASTKQVSRPAMPWAATMHSRKTKCGSSASAASSSSV